MNRTTETSDTLEHGPTQLEALADLKREELGRELQKVEPCYQLWTSVVELALRDLAYIEDKESNRELTSHERGKLNRIMEHDPAGFIHDDWFDVICDYLGISADRLRSRAPSGSRAGQRAAAGPAGSSASREKES
jgi:hypothetical protein